jgi:hypothetical protein
MKRLTLVIGAMLCGAGLATPAALIASPMTENGKVTLDVTPPSNSEAWLTLRVTVGPLPRGARIVVRSERGDVLGAVSPFGATEARTGGTYTVPLPPELLTKRKLLLTFVLEEEHGRKVRVPTNLEVTDVKLQLNH